MIYLDLSTTGQVMMVPRSYPAEGALSLELKNTIDKVVKIEDVIDLHTSQLYFNLAFALPEGADPGEWEYTLKDASGTILSTGLVMVTDLDVVEQYENQIQYEQYE